jgi:TfoX/Sxy family transcriptional regulator of competence genes
MGYDTRLAERVRALLEDDPGFGEKKMFGGICFLLRGNMIGGILNDGLIVRVGPQKYEESLKLPNTRPFDVTGKPMKGWVMVSAEGHKANSDLAAWIERGVAFVLTLPEK